MSDNTKRLRNHVASYKSLSSHRQNCLDVCDEAERLQAKVEQLEAMCALWEIAESLWDKDRVEQLEGATKAAKDSIAHVDGTMDAWLILSAALKGDT